MTSFCMTSIHVDPNEAAYRAFAHLHKIQNVDDIWPKVRRLIIELMKVRGMKTWKELTTGVQQLVRLLHKNKFFNPGLVP